MLMMSEGERKNRPCFDSDSTLRKHTCVFQCVRVMPPSGSAKNTPKIRKPGPCNLNDNFIITSINVSPAFSTYSEALVNFLYIYVPLFSIHIDQVVEHVSFTLSAPFFLLLPAATTPNNVAFTSKGCPKTWSQHFTTTYSQITRNPV